MLWQIGSKPPTPTPLFFSSAHYEPVPGRGRCGGRMRWPRPDSRRSTPRRRSLAGTGRCPWCCTRYAGTRRSPPPRPPGRTPQNWTCHQKRGLKELTPQNWTCHQKRGLKELTPQNWTCHQKRGLKELTPQNWTWHEQRGLKELFRFLLVRKFH